MYHSSFLSSITNHSTSDTVRGRVQLWNKNNNHLWRVKQLLSIVLSLSRAHFSWLYIYVLYSINRVTCQFPLVLPLPPSLSLTLPAITSLLLSSYIIEWCVLFRYTFFFLLSSCTNRSISFFLFHFLLLIIQ